MPVLFASLGSATSAALLNTVVVGAVNVGSTLIAVAFSDKFGRRFLLIEGGIQCCLAMVSSGSHRCLVSPSGGQPWASACLASKSGIILPCVSLAHQLAILTACNAIHHIHQTSCLCLSVLGKWKQMAFVPAQ